ncbi:MAG TPA: biotin transporter BioY [Bacillota bacterium]|nr:biotin transporter BioY [Bacillota bacterium]
MRLSAREMVLVALFAGLTAVMAQIAIPVGFIPVPITGQTLAVMLAGALLGARLGAFSQSVYLLLGAIGLPVFAFARAGLDVLIGPTGGFLFGFVAGAYVIGKLLERSPQPSTPYLLFSMVLGGIVVIYIPGVLQFAHVTGATLPSALAAVSPFIPSDILKVVVSAIIVRTLLARKLTGQLRALAGQEKRNSSHFPLH